jgi:spore coat polysaccharide biosynthesis protein SpsF (cytidylyltransferase family)
MKVVAIVQARMGSERLPGKVLADVAGQPLLQRVIERVSSVAAIDSVVVATTTESQDDSLVEWCRDQSIQVFRGSKDDVLDRFWRCADQHDADIIVRITADDPLKDPEVISKAIEMMMSTSEIDYVSNTLRPSYPEGLDVEVFRFSALNIAAKKATLLSDREHVTPFIWKNPDLFVLRDFYMQPDLNHWRWTVDKPKDLEFVRKIFEEFAANPLVGYREVISFLKENPKLLEINAGTRRNEGYLKSIAEDKDYEF